MIASMGTYYSYKCQVTRSKTPVFVILKWQENWYGKYSQSTSEYTNRRLVGCKLQTIVNYRISLILQIMDNIRARSRNKLLKSMKSLMATQF